MSTLQIKNSAGSMTVNGQPIVLDNDSRLSGGGGSAAPGAFENLLVRNDSTTPNDKIVITADNITLSDQSATFKNFKSVNVTADMTLSTGVVNGPDASIDNNNSWIGVFLIGKTDGTIASQLSASTSNLTGPTAPISGYTLWKLVSVFRNDGSSNFVKQFQVGRKYKLDANVSIVLSAGAATTSTDVDATAVFSPITRMAKLLVLLSGTNSADFTISPFTSATFGYSRIAAGGNLMTEIDLPVGTDQHFMYKVDTGTVTVYGIGGEFGI